jgi:hypothetical protein
MLLIPLFFWPTNWRNFVLQKEENRSEIVKVDSKLSWVFKIVD